MGIEEEYKLIKKHYGEKMMHYCRSTFLGILETPGNLIKILLEYFQPTLDLYNDLVNYNKLDDFEELINRFHNKKEVEYIDTGKSAVQLMSEAGYILFPECKSNEEIRLYKKYWRKDEMLCTFSLDRIRTCRVWFAIRKNINSIPREKVPTRDGAYGTSAISIQFTRGEKTKLSIKNRYNHSVENPDYTFLNNLENIIPGLTMAFYNDYGVRSIDSKGFVGFDLNGYVLFANKYYKYNVCLDDVYFCNNIIIDMNTGEIKEYNDGSHIIIDNYIVDLKEKTVTKWGINKSRDEFCSLFENVKKISVRIDGNNKIVTFTFKDNENIKITLNKYNRVIEFVGNSITNISTNIFENFREIRRVEMRNLLKCENNFLSLSRFLREVYLDNLVECKDNVITCCDSLETLHLPKLEKCGSSCFSQNEKLESVIAPNLKKVKHYFLTQTNVKEVNFPKLTNAGNLCFCYGNKLKNVELPALKKIGDKAFLRCELIEKLNLDNVKEVGNNFVSGNKKLKEIHMTNLEKCGYSFMCECNLSGNLNLPKLEECGEEFLYYSRVNEVRVDNLSVCENNFLHDARVKKVYAPKIDKKLIKNISKGKSNK